jgi:hypothetical protein
MCRQGYAVFAISMIDGVDGALAVALKLRVNGLRIERVEPLY